MDTQRKAFTSGSWREQGPAFLPAPRCCSRSGSCVKRHCFIHQESVGGRIWEGDISLLGTLQWLLRRTQPAEPFSVHIPPWDRCVLLVLTCPLRVRWFGGAPAIFAAQTRAGDCHRRKWWGLWQREGPQQLYEFSESITDLFLLNLSFLDSQGWWLTHKYGLRQPLKAKTWNDQYCVFVHLSDFPSLKGA